MSKKRNGKRAMYAGALMFVVSTPMCVGGAMAESHLVTGAAIGLFLLGLAIFVASRIGE